MNINLQQAKSLLKNNKVIAYIKQNGMPVYTNINEFVPFNNAVFKSICIDLLHDNNIQLTYDDNITYGELATINNNDLLDNVILSDDWVGVTSLKDLKFFTGFTTIKNLSNDNDIFANIEEIDMRNISTIGSYAFLNHTGISLYNVYNITTINSHAFDNAILLDNTYAFNSLTTIGEYAFYNTQFNSIIHLGSTSILPHHCFENAVFNNISFNSNNTTIGNYCFKNATIGHFTNESNITTIGYNAFENVNTEMYLQLSGLISLGNAAFKGSNISIIKSLGSITSIGEYTFNNCQNITNLDFIPNTVTSIGSHAFDGCSNIKKIELPLSVTSIASYAISNCSKLRNIKSLGSITALTSSMVDNCPNLEIIYLPDTLEDIDSIAFTNCANLKIFANVKNYTYLDHTFNNCPKLDTIWFSDTLDEIKVQGIQICDTQFIKTIKLGRYLDPSTGYNITDYEIIPETIVVDGEEQTINHTAFERMTLLTTIDANNNTFNNISIDNNTAIMSFTNLMSTLAAIPNNISLLHIGVSNNGGIDASNIETLSISSLLDTDHNSFRINQGNLRNVILDDNENAQNLAYYTFPVISNNSSVYIKIGKNVKNIQYGSSINPENINATYTINVDFANADNLKLIGYSGLSANNTKINFIPALPKNLEIIKYGAISGNNNTIIDGLVMPKSIKEITSAITNLDLNNHNIVIPPTADVSIESGFCNLKNVKHIDICNTSTYKTKLIKYSFSSVGDKDYNIHFDNFYVTKDVSIIASFSAPYKDGSTGKFTINNLIFDKEYVIQNQSNVMFSQTPTVNNLYLPDNQDSDLRINCLPINVKNVTGGTMKYMFANLINISSAKSIEYMDNIKTVFALGNGGMELINVEDVSIPNTVEYIGQFTYRNTSNLKSFNMPENIKYISQNAFQNSAIKTVNLHNIKWIGYNSFDNTKIKEITIPGTIVDYPNMSDLDNDKILMPINGAPYNAYGAFANCKWLEKAILPNNMVTLPYYIFNNCPRLMNINLDNIRVLQPYSLANTNVNIDLETTQLTTIGDHALYNVDSIYKPSLTLSNTITTIDDAGLAMKDTDYILTDIVLPQNLHKLSKSVLLNHRYLSNINLENIDYFDSSCLSNTKIDKLGNTENAIDLADTSIKYIGESIVKGAPLYSKLYKFDISNTKCEGEPSYTLKDICNNTDIRYASASYYSIEIDLSNSGANRIDTSAFIFKFNTNMTDLYSHKVKLNWTNQHDYINLEKNCIYNSYKNVSNSTLVVIDVSNSSLGEVNLCQKYSGWNTSTNFVNLPMGDLVYINPSTNFAVSYPSSAVKNGNNYGIDTLKFGPAVNRNTSWNLTNIFDCCRCLDMRGSNVTAITYNWFKNKKFEEAYIGEKTTSIDSYAFDSCSSLKKIDIPASMTSIGYHAFMYDTALSVVICRAVTPPTIVQYPGYSDNWLAGLTYTGLSQEGGGIYVPDESVEAYKTAWKSYQLYGANSTTPESFIKPLSSLSE